MRSTGAVSLTSLGSGLGRRHLLWFPWIRQLELLEKQRSYSCHSSKSADPLGLADIWAWWGRCRGVTPLRRQPPPLPPADSAVDGKTGSGQGGEQGAKQLSIRLPASPYALSSAREGAVVVHQPGQQKSIACVLEMLTMCRPDLWTATKSHMCSFSSCLHSQFPQGGFVVTVRLHSGWQELMGLRFHPMDKVEHEGRWVRGRKVSGTNRNCLSSEMD